MNPEALNTLAQSIQYLLIGLAAVFTAAKLYSSRELDKRRLEVESLERDLGNKLLTGEINIRKENKYLDGSFPILITVKITNNSSTPRILDWDQYPLKVAKLKQQNEFGEIQPVFENKAYIQHICLYPNTNKKQGAWSSSWSIFYPHSEVTMEFYWCCKTPGIYLFTISSKLPHSIVESIHLADTDNIIDKHNKKYNNQESYDSSIYFYINKYLVV